MGPPGVRISSAQRRKTESSFRPRRTGPLGQGRWRFELPSGSYSVAFQSTASTASASAVPFVTVVNNGALARVYLRQCPAGGSRGHNIAVVENARNREKVVHVTLDHNIRVIEVNVPHDHVASVRTRAEAAAAAHPPHFDPFARGVPTDWNRPEDNTLFWGERTRRYFKAVSGSGGL